MLRVVLLSLLILLGAGVLSAMELRTAPRSAVAIVQPPAEPNADISDSHDSDSHDALAKADRLDIAAPRSETPAQAAVTDEGVALPEDKGTALPEDNSIGSAEPPKPIAPHRHNPKSKKVATAARPKSEPKSEPRATVIRRSAVSQRSKADSDTEPCRLKAFGGLQQALNSTDCEL